MAPRVLVDDKRRGHGVRRGGAPSPLGCIGLCCGTPFQAVPSNLTQRFFLEFSSKKCRALGIFIVNKKALLSQRRPRDAPNIWVP